MELASLLNDEPFSDRPQSVCPALRAFLHSYNDGLPDRLRQDLYGLASDIVGSRSPARVTAWRARLCVGWARSLARLDEIPTSYHGWTLGNCSLAGGYSAQAALRDPWCHRQTLGFFRWLATARSPRPAGDRCLSRELSRISSIATEARAPAPAPSGEIARPPTPREPSLVRTAPGSREGQAAGAARALPVT